jgi:hypothetical protein
MPEMQPAAVAVGTYLTYMACCATAATVLNALLADQAVLSPPQRLRLSLRTAH